MLQCFYTKSHEILNTEILKKVVQILLKQILIICSIHDPRALAIICIKSNSVARENDFGLVSYKNDKE